MIHFATNINDCRDGNDTSRIETRFAALFRGVNTKSIGVTDTEAAAINLIDQLDAGLGREGVILVNIARREGEENRWPNGTPFAGFYVGKTYVISTITGYTLSLVKKLGLVSVVDVFDIPTVLAYIKNRDDGDGHTWTDERIERVILSQFRSFDFATWLAYWKIEKLWELPSGRLDITHSPDLHGTICWIDTVGGNCKLSTLPHEISFTPGKNIYTSVGQFPCYARLKDVPDNTAAIVVGSSGYEEQRFLELVIKGGKAAERFNLKVGDKIFD